MNLQTLKLTVWFLLSCCFFEETLQSAQVHSFGTLTCATERNKLNSAKRCELSSAAYVNYKDVKWIVSSNDKDKNIYLWAPAKILNKAGFQKRVAPDHIIKLPDELNIQKIEGIAAFKNRIVVMGNFTEPEVVQNQKKQVLVASFKLTAEGTLKEPQILVDEDKKPILFKAIMRENDKEVPSHFKVEAIAVVPGLKEAYQLLLGVREYGRSAKEGDFKYSAKILASDITFTTKQVMIKNNWKLLLDMKQAPGHGVSDLSYDPKSQRIAMLLSLESEDYTEGSLWISPLQPLLKSKDSFKKVPLNIFNHHKPEGISWVSHKGKSGVVVIADEDRRTPRLADGMKRTLDESPFWFLPNLDKDTIPEKQ